MQLGTVGAATGSFHGQLNIRQLNIRQLNIRQLNIHCRRRRRWVLPRLKPRALGCLFRRALVNDTLRS